MADKKIPDTKKRVGPRTIQPVQTGDFLPTPFRTELNKKWMDATLDRMVSKGDLEDIEAYVGSKSGRHSISTDVYLEDTKSADLQARPQLEPAITTRDFGGDLTSAITVDDIANNIAQSFDEYNYNAAYKSQGYVYNPPINKDKFINFLSYYWVTDMPVYRAVHSGDAYDLLLEAHGQLSYTFTDDNNTFELHNQMLIKFVSGYGDLDDWTYLVTGVGFNIKLIPYTSPDGKSQYPQLALNTATVSDEWDELNVKEISYTGNTYGQITPQGLVAAYNADTNRTPRIKVYDDSLNKEIYLTSNQIIRFDDTWPGLSFLETQQVWATVIDPITHDIELVLVIDAFYDPYGNIKQELVQGISEELQELAYNLIDTWDTDAWDAESLPAEIKDYIVIDRRDSSGTAWARTNYWVHRDTLRLVEQLIPAMDIEKYVASWRQAKRPILEFEPGMKLYNGPANNIYDDVWVGVIDFALDNNSLPVPGGAWGWKWNGSLTIPAGSTVVFINVDVPSLQDKVFKIHVNGQLEPIVNLEEGNTLVVRNAINSEMYEFWTRHDLRFDGTRLTYSQIKYNVNQEIKFDLVSDQGTPLSDFAETQYTGNRIFTYKKGTGTIDPELGFPLVYKDSARGAEIIFQNDIITRVEAYSVKANDVTVGLKEYVQGYSFYLQNGKPTAIYKPSAYPLGAKTSKSYSVIDDTSDATIDLGYDAWRVDKEFVVHSHHNDLFTVTEKISEGVWNNKRVSEPDIVLAKNNTYKFWDLMSGQTLKFWTLKGENIETTAHDATVARISDELLALTIPDVDGLVLYYGYDNNRLRGRIVVLPEIDSRYHKVYINEKFTPLEGYTLNSDSIVIPSELISNGDIIEVEYYSNSPSASTDLNIPEVHTHNANNEVISEFIVSETLGHWQSLIEAVPGFDGQAFGINNYFKQPRVDITGGEIFLHDDISIMHDINYSNKEGNITAALSEQARDWMTFRKRFETQVRRISGTKTWKATSELVDAAINQIVATRRGYALYKDSNMVFEARDPNREERHLLNLSSNTVTTYFPLASERTVQDHVYVYLLEDALGTTKLVERILVKDVDYTIEGQVITILTTPAAGVNPYVIVRWMPISEPCQVPPSLAKLGLANYFTPTISDGILTCHDGYEYAIGAAEINNTLDPNYNPTAAALWELENRIHAGMTNATGSSYIDMLPSNNTNTWYSIDTINEYCYANFTEWARNDAIETLNNPDFYDASNPWTWNYSSVSIGGKYEGRTPGYWKGLYTVLFGTHQPHITPWHMLGFTSKPTWWDTYYSWTDTLKRESLIEALKTGLVSEPNITPHQDLMFARYEWNWETQCPVDINGNLLSPNILLGAPVESDASQEFVYGDWGPVEWKWRNSATGQAAMLDAIIKLNPTTAWTRYYQPEMVITNPVPEAGWVISRIDNKVISPSNFLYPGIPYRNILESIDVIESDSGFSDDVELELITPNSVISPTATALVEDGKITHVTITDRGTMVGDYIEIIVKDSIDPTLTARFKSKVTQKAFLTHGLAEVQHNFQIRNSYSFDWYNYYNTLDTRLLQKMGGFTSKHLLTVSTESGPQGEFDIGDSDMELFMYEGAPSEVVVASDIIITKRDSGYEVKGLSNDRQRFKFYEPSLTGAMDSTTVEVVEGITVKKYREFANVASIVEFGTKFARIQDTYNFVRGYRAYMEAEGFEFETPKDVAGLEFARWAVTADINTTFVVSVGKTLRYNFEQGSVLPFGSLASRKNSLLGANGLPLDINLVEIARTSDSLYVAINNGVDAVLGSVGIAKVNYEHALLIANTTEFNDIIYNDVINQKHDRLYISGQRTGDWTGAKRASGYLIEDGRIVQNWDSSVKAIADYYDPSVLKFNDAVERAENLTIGNADREWARKMRLSNNSMLKFFQGAIREKGTNAIIDRLDRNDIIGLGDADISIHEEFMFRHSYYGENDAINITEIELTEEQIWTDPQLIDFTDDSLTYVNRGSDIIFDTVDYETFESGTSSRMLTAGEVLIDELTVEILDITDTDTIWDTIVDDVTAIEGWNDFTSYKKGDLVRFQGNVYSLNVEKTGLTLNTEGVIVDGVITFLNTDNTYVIPNGAVGTIDGTDITFGTTTSSQPPAVVTGTNTNVSIMSPSALTINGTPLNLIKTEQVQVVGGTGDPTLVGTAVFNPSFTDSTGKSITLNGNVVDFTKDNKAPEVVETFTADGLTTTFPLAQSLGFDGTYTWAVTGVTVGTQTMSTNSYTITGGTIVFDNAPGVPAKTAGSYWVETLSNSMSTVITTQIRDDFTVGLETIRSTYQSISDPVITASNYQALMSRLSTQLDSGPLFAIEEAVNFFLTTFSADPLTSPGGTGTLLRLAFVDYLNTHIALTNAELNTSWPVLDEVDLDTFAVDYAGFGSDHDAWWGLLNSAALTTLFAPLVNSPTSVYTNSVVVVPAVTPLITVTIYPSFAMDAIAIRNKINAEIPIAEKITASINTNGNLVIVYDVQPSNTTAELVLSPSTTNTALGFPAAGLTAGTSLSTVYQHVAMDVDYIAGIINASINLPTISAGSVGGALQVTDPSGSISFDGLAREELGLPLSYVEPPVATGTDSTITSVIAQINLALATAGNTAVSAELNGNRIVLISENETLEISGDAFELYTNLETGTISNLNQTVSNVFELSEWTLVDDPAEITIWTTDDTKMQTTTTGNIALKANSWNTFKFQNFGFYSVTEQYDDTGNVIGLGPECSICAGTATSDGNDAEVTINADHNLTEGDFVIILNSTTQPNVDGIHMVTRVHPTKRNTFYIDQFIDECGYASSILVMRTTKFPTYDDMISALASPFWSWKTGDKIWTLRDELGVRGTYVWTVNVDQAGVASVTLDPTRVKTNRVTNSTLESIAIYDGEQHATKIVLEVYDPIRMIIPGVVDREIDQKSQIDFAVYSDSTDINFEGDENNAWGLAEVGKTWWDISTVRYYDYDQGDAAYKAKNWGRLFPGSSIDIYEWTRSTVPPDEWSELVDAGTEINGEVPSGTAYSVYDSTINEDVYYYTEKSEWDSLLGQYTSYYYFWVKNKFTVPNNKRMFPVDTLAKMLADPTGNGISWCAAIDTNQMIVSNVQPFLNDNTVMQINKHRNLEAHSSWTAIKPVVDLIPGYWYVGLRDNLVGTQSLTGVKFPNATLHKFNRYGDDRALGQGWYTSTKDARRQAVVIANRLLQGQNLQNVLPGIWDRTISQVVTVDTLTVDLTEFWEYADYISPLRDREQVAGYELSRFSEIETIDPVRIQLVKLNKTDPESYLDQSEFYQWIDGEWIMVEKKNATIRFNDLVFTELMSHAWDMQPWDSNPWDVDYGFVMEKIVYALRHDLFVRDYVQNFNIFFFGMVEYAISVQSQCDWVYKTTYVQLNIDAPVRTPRKYTSNNIEEITGFINTVKPYHTKIRNIYQRQHILDVGTLEMDDDLTKKDIWVKFDVLDREMDYAPTNYASTFDDTWYPREFVSDFTDTVFEQEIGGNAFDEPQWYQWVAGTTNVFRNTTYGFGIGEFVSFDITTNRVNSDGTDISSTGVTPVADVLRHIYLQDQQSNVKVYAIRDGKTGTLASDFSQDDAIITLASGDGAKFTATGGYAWIEGEVIRYGQRLGDRLLYVERQNLGTFGSPDILSGTEISDLEGGMIDTFRGLDVHPTFASWGGWNSTTWQSDNWGATEHFALFYSPVRMDTKDMSILDPANDYLDVQQIQGQ